MSASAAQVPLAANPRHVFMALFAVYFLLILLPILLADRPWNDDLARAASGSFGWNNNGRHLANYLMKVLALGSSRLFDLSPLPQLLAIGLLSLTGALMARRFAIESPIAATLIALPLGAQPFFLENLAFQFDAGIMALAMLMALWPILRPRSGITGFLLGGLALLACLLLYQPAINVFLVFVLVEFALLVFGPGDFRGACRGLLLRLAQAALTMLVYRTAIHASLDDWILAHSRTVSVLDWPAIAGNLRLFLDFIQSGFAPRIGTLMLVLGLAVVVLPLPGLLHAIHHKPSPKERWGWAATVLALPAMAVFAAFGPMLLLEQPVLMPRVLIGVGALISAAFLLLYRSTEGRPASRRGAGVIAASALVICAVHAAAFGNAAKAQADYERTLATAIAEHLQTLERPMTVETLVVDGSIGLAPLTEHAATQLPILRQLILPYLHYGDFHTRHFLQPFVQHVGHTPAIVSAEDAPALPSGHTVAASLQGRHHRLVRSGSSVRICLPIQASPMCTTTPAPSPSVPSNSSPESDVGALQ